ITVLSEGTRLNVINTENSEWHAVETTSGQQGYVSAKYLKITGPVVEQDAPEVEAPSAEDTSVNAAEGVSAKVTTAVHLRDGKSTASQSLGVISAGTAVKASDIGDNSWYKVFVNGKTGYMFREYVRLDSETVPEQPAVNSGTSRAAKTTAGVHMRSGKGTNYSSVALVNEYTPITVTDTSDSSWYGVLYNGKAGYISSQYISLPGSTVPENTESSTTAQQSEFATAWTAAGVYMRKGKGTEHDTVTLLNENTPVIILDTSNSDWYEVSANGVNGYVYSQYIQTESSDATADIMVTDAYLNLRKTADRNGDILMVIPENTAVAVIAKNNADWYSVSYNGKTGYVSAEYLK
ncbi:MAG: SH3 domain-containing protein, partial [Clostridia bacterium]|nr:SH3 domain-containing protein [Clostridia bacterium]